MPGTLAFSGGRSRREAVPACPTGTLEALAQANLCPVSMPVWTRDRIRCPHWMRGLLQCQQASILGARGRELWVAARFLKSADPRHLEVIHSALYSVRLGERVGSGA